MKKIRIIAMVMLISILFLQGCSTEGTTSIKVVVSENGKRVEAELKADQSKQYEWLYFTKENNLTESATEFSNDLFSDTYIQKYGFVIDERGQDTIYFVLYQTDDIESGKVFEYDIAYDKDGNIVLSDKKEGLLKNNAELLEKVKASQ